MKIAYFLLFLIEFTNQVSCSVDWNISEPPRTKSVNTQNVVALETEGEREGEREKKGRMELWRFNIKENDFS